MDEAGTAAIKSVELDAALGGRAVQHRVEIFGGSTCRCPERKKMPEASTKQLEAEIEQLNCLAMVRNPYENRGLSEESQQLRAKINRNPEVTCFDLENIRLLAQLRRFQEFYEEGEREVLMDEVSKSRDQLLQFLSGNLERQDESKPTMQPQGYPGKFYCPRMNSMNKLTYAAICTHLPTKPVLIFVSSRRQTRLTTLDLIQFAALDEYPRQFLNMAEEELQMILCQVIDQRSTCFIFRTG